MGSFDSAMLTVRSSRQQLAAMADRAMRAGELLRTRVDVERSAHSQALLASPVSRQKQRASAALEVASITPGDVPAGATLYFVDDSLKLVPLN